MFGFAFVLLLALAAKPVAAQEPSITLLSESDGVNVAAVVQDSFKLLILEHATRVAVQEKTRRELTGPFWNDYKRSLRIPQQWDDTDAWWVNYLGHPVHGAAAGRIWLHHDNGAPIGFALNSRYWSSRGRATIWSAVYSIQFEVGLFSEASIGNVGLRPETVGWVDHVVTPVGALGMIVVEDTLDGLIKRVESSTRNRALRLLVRMALNPARTLANISSGNPPWHREDRRLDWR